MQKKTKKYKGFDTLEHATCNRSGIKTVEIGGTIEKKIGSN